MPDLKLLLLALPALMLITCSDTDAPPEVSATLDKIRDLPSEITELSGMTEVDGGVQWMINDGGNAAILYAYNPALGTIERRIAVKGAVNIDWEEISQDDQHLYIGDFGNNGTGNRSDLRIDIIRKADLSAALDTVSVSGTIDFIYEDQTDFTPQPANLTSFDCEAFIVVGDSVVLFTKDWLTEKTRIYTLPVTPGDHKARFRREFDVRGLVTGAAFSGEQNELLLLGYDGMLQPFLWIVPDFGLDNLTFNNSNRVEFKETAQTEAIAFSANGAVYVGSESFDLFGLPYIAALYRARY
jgi:hypothetical protein